MNEHECSLCNSAFYNHQQLKHHMNAIHHGVQPTAIGCILCGSGFDTQADMINHLTRDHRDRLSRQEIIKYLDNELDKAIKNLEVEQALDLVYVIEEEP